MKQTKHIKMLLIAVLALLLAIALVACNGDKKNNNSENLEQSEGMKQLIKEAKSDMEAMLNYFLSNSETVSDGDFAEMVVQYIGPEMYDELGAHVDISIGDCSITVYEVAEDAKNISPHAIGNKLISNDALYQQILKSKHPTSITRFSKEQIEFMENKIYRGLDKNEFRTYSLMYVDGDNPYGGVVWNCDGYEKGVEEGIEFGDESLYEEESKFLSVNYTDDSYVKFDKKTGLTSYKLTSLISGWHVEDIFDDDQQLTGKYAATYEELKSTSTFTIPEKIGDFDISEVEIYLADDSTVNSLVIEKVIDKVYLLGNIKQITIPLSDKPFVQIEGNTALKTIKFKGTTQQWEELYGIQANNWSHVENGITFTVSCTNGSITYPKTNA